MARKKRLIDTLNQYLYHDNFGSFTRRKYRLFVMNKIIDDFYNTRMVPPHWYALTTSHVQRLVDYWQKNGVSDLTIRNYLAALRYFIFKINHTIVGIDNASLKLIQPKKGKKPIIDGDDILAKIKEPIAHILFALQIKFGLTLHEALHIIPGIHIDARVIWITRELSVNHKDRVVPILTDNQKFILEQLNCLTGLDQNLITRFGGRRARLAYRKSMSSLNLSTNISYRYLYAHARFKDLCLQHNTIDSRHIVIQETSFSKTSPIWRNIHE